MKDIHTIDNEKEYETGLWMVHIDYPTYQVDTEFARTIEDVEDLYHQGYYPLTYIQDMVELGKNMGIPINLNLVEYCL